MGKEEGRTAALRLRAEERKLNLVCISSFTADLNKATLKAHVQKNKPQRWLDNISHSYFSVVLIV